MGERGCRTECARQRLSGSERRRVRDSGRETENEPLNLSTHMWKGVRLWTLIPTQILSLMRNQMKKSEEKSLKFVGTHPKTYELF